MSKTELLKSSFAGIGFPLDDAEVLSFCLSLCGLFSLSPEALAGKWEAHVVNVKANSITTEALTKWKPTLAKQQQQFKKTVAKVSVDKDTVGNALAGVDVSSYGVADEASTQAAKKRRITVVLPDDDLTTHKIDNSSLFKSNKNPSSRTPTSDDSASAKGKHQNSNGNSANGKSANGNSANGSHHTNGHQDHSADDKKSNRFIPVLDDVWSSSQDDADASFALRPNPGKVEVTVAPTVQVGEEAEFELWDDVENSVEITVEPNSQMSAYRYMGEEVEQRAYVLDEKLVSLGSRIGAEHMLTQPEMFHIPAQDPVVAMGRICPDADGAFGDKSVVLEADEERTKARVLLDFRSLSSENGYSVFPGQVVVVEGINTSGKTLTVTDVYEPKPVPLYKNPSYVPPRAHPYAPLTMLIAAGPFTTTENLSYRPLDHFLEVVERTNPQVVVLVGPFVDTTQPLVQMSDEPFMELFKSKISATLTRATGLISGMSLPPSKLILIPHPRDPDTSPLPQPPFSSKEYQIDSKWINLVSNPCTMRINDFSLGVSSVDVIKHLASQELSRNMAGDRFSRLCGHLLKQQSYYPLYPPAPEVSIEYTKLQGLELPYAPDVMIVPSELQYFAKNVNDTLFINPGRLSKGKTGGTYAKVTVFPELRSIKNEDEEMVDVDDNSNGNSLVKKEVKEEGSAKKDGKKAAVRVVRRTKVEIVRI